MLLITGLLNTWLLVRVGFASNVNDHPVLGIKEVRRCDDSPYIQGGMVKDILTYSIA